jgi:hypothetical protein
MATDKIALRTYVEPSLAALVAETAEALGQSRSGLIEGILQSSESVLVLLRDTARMLDSAPERHREALAELAASFRPMVEEVARGVEEMGAGGPPPSNTGVRE